MNKIKGFYTDLEKTPNRLLIHILACLIPAALIKKSQLKHLKIKIYKKKT